MDKHIVMTVVGPDKVGIVEDVTRRVLAYDGNVEESRMARLGGEFAMLMFLSLPEQKVEEATSSLTDFKEGYQVFIRHTGSAASSRYDGWLPYRVTVSGADHEGIINSVTRHFSEKGINIERMDTSTAAAPMSGTLLFTMMAIVVVPPGVSYQSWRTPLHAVEDEMNVTIEVAPYRG